MALAIDASTPAPAQSTVGGTGNNVVSNTFSPPAGSTIFVFWGNGHTSNFPASITDSLVSHLTWSTDFAVTDPAGAAAGVFWANCPSAQTSMTVTLTWSASTEAALYIMPVVFTGAATSPLGATNSTGSAASAGTLAVTPTAAGSYVFGGIMEDSNTAPSGLGTNQTVTVNAHSTLLSEATHGTESWVQYSTVQTTAGAAVTISSTGPVSDMAMVAVEILAAVAAVFPTANVNAPMKASYR